MAVDTSTITKRGRGTMTHSAAAELIDNVKCRCCSDLAIASSVRRNVATVRVVTWHTVHIGARLHLEQHMRKLFNDKVNK
jgi:hypothetical protein